MQPAAGFYFDLADPLSYLAAERVLHALPVSAEWRPVLACELGPVPAEAFRCAVEQDIFRSEVERRAAALGLQPLRWPHPFPFDSAMAMRVATYARSIGRTVPFALAAFRQAYAGGRSLSEPDNVLIAAAACEMHPSAVLGAAARTGLAARLAEETAHAAALGVPTTPAIVLADGSVHAGEDAPERAAAALARLAP